MRVVVDINGILERASGLGNYIRLLVANLAEIDAENDYLLYVHQATPPTAEALRDFIPQRPNFRLLAHRLPTSLALWAEYRAGIRVTEHLLGRHGVSVYHGPSGLVPRFKNIRSVLTIHHWSPEQLVLPPNASARTRMYYEATRWAIEGAGRVVTVSRYTKDALVSSLGVAPEKVSVVYPGGPLSALQEVAAEKLPAALAAKLPGPYVLFPGPLHERKNLPGFLEAFASVKDRLGDCRLAATGEPWESYRPALREAVAKLGLEDRVVFLGNVSHRELALLYRGAACMAYPSLFEGFGAPPLEAMGLGCPVLASNASAVPEATGDAAILVDPKSRSSMAEGLVQILTDEAKRTALRRAGFERVKRFSWRKMAQELLAIYRELATS